MRSRAALLTSLLVLAAALGYSQAPPTARGQAPATEALNLAPAGT
ncbi:MAG TPA: hypothetical protein VJ256_00615 [Dehalococcoidia bacterium]|nr:hypothetical protein [Dehalococcoidia bacterium]HLB29132.1 hypothetical protein [Dehalococcoidia bacterium]